MKEKYNRGVLKTIIDRCPICNNKLREILEDGYVVNFWCNKCKVRWDLEDLEFKELKKIDLDKWLKNEG